MKNPFKSKLNLVKGTRFTSFLFIGLSILIAAGILFAANMYYNIDTGEVVTEEIQRITGALRATGGAIVGGSATQNPDTNYIFQVVGSSKLATTTFATGTVALTAANQILKFTGGVSDYYTGFQASTSTTSGQSIIYTLPAAKPDEVNFVLTSNATGIMEWKSVSGVGAGDISDVGDVASGRAFTSDVGTNYGQTLWFHPNANYTVALTADATLAANATATLPAISGTNYLTLTSGGLGTGGVLFADAGLIATSSNFTWATSTRTLSLGTSGTSGQLRIYDEGSHYLGFAAASSMSANTIYHWPANYGSNNTVLTTDASGNLTWTSLSGISGVTGTGAAGRVAFWDGTSNITSDAGFTWSTSTSKLTLSGGLIASLIESTSDLTLQTTGTGHNIILNPVNGGVYFKTESGYPIAESGKEVLREMIPIMGFDLPVRTATSGTVAISRAIESYPLSPCAAGTDRIHKLVIRYGSVGTTTWAVATTTGVYTSFDLPPTSSTTTGTVYTATTDIPTPSGDCTSWSQVSDTDDWWVQITPTSNDTMIYQIFLAAYDKMQ